MTRADSTTSVVARRIIERIRALSPTTLTAAMTLPSRPRIGAPTEATPRCPSSLFWAHPRLAPPRRRGRTGFFVGVGPGRLAPRPPVREPPGQIVGWQRREQDLPRARPVRRQPVPDLAEDRQHV